MHSFKHYTFRPSLALVNAPAEHRFLPGVDVLFNGLLDSEDQCYLILAVSYTSLIFCYLFIFFV